MRPFISVVIPALNAGDVIEAQLEALTRQTYGGPWEVVVSDDGSTDGTVDSVRAYRTRLPTLVIVRSPHPTGAAAARNRGARAALGSHLAFCDADDVVGDGWLEAMAVALETHDFVTGAIDHDSLNASQVQRHSKGHVEAPQVALRFLPYALSGNMAIRRTVFDDLGGFPENLRAQNEDIAFSWTAQLRGHELGFAPDAIVAYRHRSTMRSLWRQQRAYGFGDAVLYRNYRGAGVPKPTIRSIVGAYWRILCCLPLLPRAGTRTRFVAGLAKRWGRLRGSMRERVFYL